MFPHPHPSVPGPQPSVRRDRHSFATVVSVPSFAPYVAHISPSSGDCPQSAHSPSRPNSYETLIVRWASVVNLLRLAVHTRKGWRQEVATQKVGEPMPRGQRNLKVECRCGELIYESDGEWIHTAFKNDPYYCQDGFRPQPKSAEVMTTYLATEETNAMTLAFCSRFCRSTRLGPLSPTWIKRNDDSYEFDEVCANCGAIIPVRLVGVS